METQGYVIFTQGASSNVCKWLSNVAKDNFILYLNFQ